MTLRPRLRRAGPRPLKAAARADRTADRGRDPFDAVTNPATRYGMYIIIADCAIGLPR